VTRSVLAVVLDPGLLESAPGRDTTRPEPILGGTGASSRETWASIYITIATADSNGQPWNTPLYAAYDEHYNFYWASWTESVHSRNIRQNPAVFLVVYDSTVPEGTGEGIYINL
jgi:Pyridoxamine 5'-phosphate oxidase